jgi:hypothetical protein
VCRYFQVERDSPGLEHKATERMSRSDAR